MTYILSSPAIFSLELTAACNGRCSGCCNVFLRERGRRPSLTASNWRRILHVIAPHAHHIRLTGGEPTLHPQFTEIVTGAVTFNLPFTVFTNGLWIDPDHIVNVLAKTPGCAGLLISLHGADAATHESFSNVPGSFDVVTENIARATAAGLTAVTSTVLTRYNYHQVAAITALSQRLGAHHAVFSRYLGRALPSLEPSPAELLQAVESVEQLRRTGQWVKFGDCIPQCFARSSSTGCLAGVAYCVIGPWGHMRPCTHVDIDCGNLLKVPLLEAWNSPPMKEWREMIPPACEQHCDAFSQCHGGCRATALIRGLDRDPLMTAPLSEHDLPPPEQVELYENQCPVGHYTVREESFGYVLLGPRLIPVSHRAKPLLDMCDGTTTLRQIEELYGQEGLCLIAELYQKGLVYWAK